MLEKVFRRQVYYIVSIIFLVIAIVYFAAIIGQPYIGVDIKNINGHYIVALSDPYGEGYKLGICKGDLILKINNDDPAKYRFVQRWNLTEGASTIEFRKPDQATDYIINFPDNTGFVKLFSEIPLIILGFVFWFMGFMTWFRRPFLVQARALFWFNWFISLAIVLVPASSRCLLFAKELEYISLSLLPIFLLKLVSVFPKNDNNRVNRLSHHLFVFLFTIITIYTIFQSLGIIFYVGLLRKLIISTVILGIFLAIWNLSLLIKLPKDNPEKNQACIILLGMVIGFFPFIILTAILQILDFKPLVNAQVSTLFLFVIPATWFYVIVNKYLSDSLRLFKVIISFFIVGIIISFIVASALFTLQVVKTINLEIYLASLFLTMLFLICSYFGYIAICNLLGKYFFKEKQGYKQRINEFNKNIKSLLAEDKILEDMLKSLGIEGAFIIIENAQIGCLRKAVGRFQEKQNEQTELEDFFHNNQRLEMEPKLLPDDFPAAVYIPFISHDSTCGIFFGHRTSRIKFIQSELSFLTLLAGQLAHRLIMSFVIKKLTGENDVLTNIINKLTKEIKFLTENFRDSRQRILDLQSITNSLARNLEQERKLIVKDIYNGPLHSGLDLSRWMKYLKEESLPDDRKQKVINYMQDLIEDVNHELHLIANELHPPTLADLGLLTAIELLCQEIMFKEQSLISLKTRGISSEDRFKEEVEITAYRFLQEGIMNSIQHSGSNRQRVYIELTESRLELAASDSGRGFDVGQIEDWLLKGTHFGIVGMKERIESLGGELEINSAIHKGTTIKAKIPILSI